jgi:hypothetical protein
MVVVKASTYIVKQGRIDWHWQRQAARYETDKKQPTQEAEVLEKDTGLSL